MKKAILALALSGGICATPTFAQDADTSFSTYGLCQSALSQWYQDQWQGERKISGAKGGMPDDFGYQFHCVHLGDAWYIVPWRTER